jgi:hypothetical protein
LCEADSKARELDNEIESLDKRLCKAKADGSELRKQLREASSWARKFQEQENNTARALKAFWTAREDYYRALHRGIGAEQGSNLKRLLGFRRQSLLADLDLISALGGSVVLREEALSLGDHAYDGAKHQWYNEGEDPAPNGAIATVYLPGWTFGEYHTKASLGAKERSGG